MGKLKTILIYLTIRKHISHNFKQKSKMLILLIFYSIKFIYFIN